MEPICTDAGVNFQANSGGPNVQVSEPGNNYGCLGTSPNPSWFYLEISDPGDIIMELSAPTDIDFIIWGPYPNLATAQATCGSHQNIVPNISGCGFLGLFDCSQGCSYSGAATETPGIPNAQVGEVYVLLITNYANQVQNISLTQTSGTGGTDCTILQPECLISFFEANISACINGTGSYDVTGVIEYEDAPNTGNLIVQDCFGTQHIVASAPFPAAGVVNYTIPGLPANGAACSLTTFFSAEPTCQNGPLNYTAPTCDCFFTNIEANISACDPNDNTFSVSGLVEFINPPTTGQLIIEDCNGNQQAFNAPFTSPINYNLAGLNSDGTPNCELTATFTANVSCNISVGPYDNPANCTCDADAGTYTDGVVGDANSTNPWLLCFGDELDVIANGDFDVTENTSHPATYDPGIWLLVYDCPPTVGPPGDINTDPCLLGVASTADQAWTIANTTGSGNTLYFVPVTMYSMVDGTYAIGFGGGDLCYDLGPTYPVTFLPEVTSTQVQDCQAGTATVTVNGGAPAFDGSNFTASNLAPASATFNNTTAANGGTITISGLVDGDNWSFDITDNNGCPITVSGVFQGVEDPAFTYPGNTYCQTQLDPAANITGTPGGTFTSAPAGLVITAGSGLIDLSASAPGTYTVTYTTPDPICFDTEIFVITVNPEPAIDPLTDQVFCESFTFPAITGTSLTGNQAYYTDPNGAGTQYNPGDFVNFADLPGYPVTLYIYDETGTTPNCTDEVSFQLTINITPILDTPVDAEECNEYVLPVITGTNLSGNEAFYTAPNGGGTTLNTADIVNILGTTTYYVYDETGSVPNCSSETSFTVTINFPPTFALAYTDPSACAIADGTITISGLDPTTNYDITYSASGVPQGPTGMMSDGAGNIIITGLGIGSYTDFVVSLNGCTTTDNTIFNLVEPNAPAIDAGPNQTVCDGVAVTLTADNPNGAIITWNNGVNDGVPFNQAVGTVAYTVTADLDNCISTDVVNVTVHPAPTVFAGNDVTVCNGQSVVLTGTGAQSYVWTNGVTNGVAFTPAATQTYTVTGTSQFGCVSTDDVTVNVEGLLAVTFSGDNLEGCTPVTVTFTNTSATASGSECVWSLSNGTVLLGCDNVAYTFTNPGCYDVALEITSANGCSNSATIEDYVCVQPYPNAYFTYAPNQLTTINTTVNFSNGSIGASNYQWFFGDGATSNAVDPTHTYPEIEGTYEVTLVASTPFGCTDTVRSIVNVAEELIFYLPNTFTPDGNDFNETFQPVFTSGYDPFDFHLMIFNRWGELIFESYDASIGWDGTYGGKTNGGKIVKDGTYVWKIEVKTKLNDERKIFVGHVNVLK